MSSRKSVGIALTAKVITVGLVLTLGAFVIHPPSTTHAAGVNQARGTTLREGFVVRYENGHSVCRIASADEATQMFQRVSRRAQKVGLHRLTDVNSAQATSSGIQTPGLNIILRGTTQLESAPQAKAAFIRAAANWQARLQTPITVVIDVDYGPTAFGDTFPSGVLGQTGSQQIENSAGYPSLRSALIAGRSNQSEGTLYNSLPINTVPTDIGSTSYVLATSATLRAVGLMNPVANPDGEPSGAWGDPPSVAFNSNFTFDFDPTDGIDSNKIDFDAVATHEIGHALGFTSGVGDKEAFPSDPTYVSVWDLFRFRPGTTLSTFPSASRILSSGGTQVFYNSGPELGLSTGRPDGSGGDLAQASHWKASDLTGVYIGIMDPFIADGQRQIITNNDVLALNSFGYRLTTESPAPYTSTPTGTTVNLTPGVPQSGTIPASASQSVCQTSPTQYKIQVPVNATQLDISLSGNQDVDLHARSSLRFVNIPGWPGIGDYTSNSSATSESIDITPSSYLPLHPGVYYVAVDNCGPAAADYTVSATVFSSSTTSAIDDSNYFVTQHYADFLNRVPDSSGLAFWTSQITNCGSDALCLRQKRIDVSNAFFFEQEYQQTGAYVYRLYRASYGNNQPFPNQVPDPLNPGAENKLVSYSVFGPDRALVVGGSTLAQSQLDLANGFVTRPEFVSRYPASLDGPGFVDAVLATIKNDLGADLSSQRAALISLFNQGGRGNVIYRLADDNVQTNPIDNRALIDAEYNRAFVATEYFGYLRRDPDMAGFLFWLDQVNKGPLRDLNKQHAMVCSFITSLEYQLRFGNAASHSNQECQQ
jgi:Domain of unknown function (DUF4214)